MVEVSIIVTVYNVHKYLKRCIDSIINQTFNDFELLVIDDLGTESNSAYRQEIVFNIIDSRYRAGLPLIVTTNLTAGDFKQPKSIEFDRIADRLMERCTFIEMSGASRRREMFKHSQIEGKKRLGL